ncbi:MAG: FMN-binding protein [Turicibacter sp.]|nr:FMN-binding protein [Turicibacter sp.]
MTCKNYTKSLVVIIGTITAIITFAIFPVFGNETNETSATFPPNEITQTDINNAIAAAEDFLSQQITIFRTIIHWGWDINPLEFDDTDILSVWSLEMENTVYINNQSEMLVDAPFLAVRDGEYFAATDFRLIDLHGNGIPAIIIEFRSNPRPPSNIIAWDRFFSLYIFNGEEYVWAENFRYTPQFFTDENGDNIFQDGDFVTSGEDFEDLAFETTDRFAHIDVFGNRIPIITVHEVLALLAGIVQITTIDHRTGEENVTQITSEERFAEDFPRLAIPFDASEVTINIPFANLSLELTAIEQSAEFEELQQTLHDIAEENSRNISIADIATTKPLNQAIFHELTPRAPNTFIEPFEITGNFTNGTFIGVGEGLRGEISVEVVFSENTITEISIISSEDAPAFVRAAFETLIPDVLQEQSPNVDILSGATYISVGLLTAIADAMQQALEK